ncbi:MAG: hypothetical protein AB7G93_18300 [Bdellovibrionales bacterium]
MATDFNWSKFSFPFLKWWIHADVSRRTTSDASFFRCEQWNLPAFREVNRTSHHCFLVELLMETSKSKASALNATTKTKGGMNKTNHSIGFAALAGWGYLDQRQEEARAGGIANHPLFT